MQQHGVTIFRRVPVLRLLLSVIAGILLQYYLNITIYSFVITAIACLLALFIFNLLPVNKKFAFKTVNGLVLCFLFTAIGAIVCFVKDTRHHPLFINNHTSSNPPLLITLQEPLVTKPKSYKALATVNAVYVNHKWQPVKGNMLVYFKKEGQLPLVNYGSQLVVTKKVVNISNSGNPGAFNYQEYCAFHGIFKQVFLTPKDYSTLHYVNTVFYNEWLINTRIKVLSILRKYISSPNELSVAEALLIGYREDLDKELVQAYSNTGVVHIIAISGLHLGMIYGLLVFLFKPLQRFKWAKVIKPITIVLVLWGFTFIAGAAPSILRSAVMFTFIVFGEAIGKRSNIYNTLAASAMVILLANPYSLWDVGFQLSYAAVLSIVMFSKTIENWFYFQNKALKYLWSLNALTISAQILTLPIIIYYFHQFPTLFFVTNFVAVPLSGIILYGELALLLFSFIPAISAFIGKVLTALLWFMNDFILRINRLPFSVWNGLQINVLQSLLLYASIACIALWLLRKNNKALVAALSFALFFVMMRSYQFMLANKQSKLIVYNVPQHSAIDIIEGRSYHFAGDSLLQQDGFLKNFHLKSSRILHRINQTAALQNVAVRGNLITSAQKKILIIDKPLPRYYTVNERIKVDAIIITHNPKIYLSQAAKLFNCKQYIFDASNPEWKIKFWKKDAAELNLNYYSVADNGAYELRL